MRETHAAIRNPEAYVRAWRIAKFGGDFDPIRVAVEEAVAAWRCPMFIENHEHWLVWQIWFWWWDGRAMAYSPKLWRMCVLGEGGVAD